MTRRATQELFDSRPDAVETSDEFAYTITEEHYAPSHVFTASLRFQHHAFELIGDMNGEEA